jgi:hypothetical protein
MSPTISTRCRSARRPASTDRLDRDPATSSHWGCPTTRTNTSLLQSRQAAANGKVDPSGVVVCPRVSGGLAVGDVELEEQPPDVCLDGPFAEDQPFGDAGVGHPLRH